MISVCLLLYLSTSLIYIIPTTVCGTVVQKTLITFIRILVLLSSGNCALLLYMLIFLPVISSPPSALEFLLLYPDVGRREKNGITARSLCMRFLFLPLVPNDVSYLHTLSLQTNTLIIFYYLSHFLLLCISLYLIYGGPEAHRSTESTPFSALSDPMKSIFRQLTGRAGAGHSSSVVHHFIKLIHANSIYVENPCWGGHMLSSQGIIRECG